MTWPRLLCCSTVAVLRRPFCEILAIGATAGASCRIVAVLRSPRWLMVAERAVVVDLVDVCRRPRGDLGHRGDVGKARRHRLQVLLLDVGRVAVAGLDDFRLGGSVQDAAHCLVDVRVVAIAGLGDLRRVIERRRRVGLRKGRRCRKCRGGRCDEEQFLRHGMLDGPAVLPAVAIPPLVYWLTVATFSEPTCVMYDTAPSEACVTNASLSAPPDWATLA